MKNVAKLDGIKNIKIRNLFKNLEDQKFEDYDYRMDLRDTIIRDILPYIKKIEEKKRNDILKNLKNLNFDNDPNSLYKAFRDDILLLVKMEYNDKKGFILTRPDNPPSEAFEYMGYSKLEINPSGKSYSLLFE